MRILVTTTPGTGHIHPLAPLAGSLRDAGHTILWAVAGEGCARVRSYGFDAQPAGMDVAERAGALAPAMPEILALEPRQRRGRLFSGFFAVHAAPRMRSDLQPIFDAFEPDLVIHELAELAAAPMAVARGLPHVTVAFSGALPDETTALLLDSIAPVWAAEDLGPPTMADLAGDIYLHPFPPSFGQQPDLSELQLLRPETFVADAGEEPPEWMADFAVNRPGVYLTFGTDPTVASAPWHAALEALGTLDVDCIATIGTHVSQHNLGPLPPNVRVESFVPQHFVLQHVSVVVSHAGAGTMLAAAGKGLPQLAIPLAADQWQNADALAASGAGLVAEIGQRSPEDLAIAVQRLLTDDHIRNAAGSVAAEIAEMPHPDRYVSVMELLAQR